MACEAFPSTMTAARGPAATARERAIHWSIRFISQRDLARVRQAAGLRRATWGDPFHRARRASLPAGGPGRRRARGLGALRRGLLRTGLVSQRDRRSAPARRDRVRHGPAVAAIATGKDRAPRARGTARLGLSLHGLGGLSGERARGREQVPSGRSARVGAVPASVDTEGGTRAPRGVVPRRGRGLRDQPGGCRQRHGAGRSVLQGSLHGSAGLRERGRGVANHGATPGVGAGQPEVHTRRLSEWSCSPLRPSCCNSHCFPRVAVALSLWPGSRSYSSRSVRTGYGWLWGWAC